MSDAGFRRAFFVVLLLLTIGAPACVEAAQRSSLAVKACPAPTAIVLADGWSVGKYLASGGRTRIVQICVVVMCIALFIMMKKLT